MVRHDHVGVVTEPQQGVVLEMVAPLESVDFFDQRDGIDDGAIANHAHLARMQRARRHQAQDKLLAVDDQRMGGVVAALKAHDDVGIGGQQIDNLAFAFIAPLGANHGNSLHNGCPGRHRRATGRVRPRTLGASIVQSWQFKV